MNMKRFLILFILIVFAAESYAGPGNVKWMVSQGEFEKDRKECIESIDKNLSSEVFGKALEECMAEKGYQYQPTQNVVRRTGPSVYRQTGWMVSQDAFEKDREQCIQTFDDGLDSEAFGKALEECLAKKGYTYETLPESPPDEKDTAKNVGKALLVTAGVALLVAVVAVAVANWEYTLCILAMGM
jgi:hypothetical protein